MDARNLHEYYPATFRTAVREGHADGIMTAYNQINGVPAGVSPILKAMRPARLGLRRLLSTDGQAATHWVQDQHYFATLDEAIAAAIGPGGSGVLLQSNVAPNVNSAFDDGPASPRRTSTRRSARRCASASAPATSIRPPSVPYKAIQAHRDAVAQRRVDRARAAT